MPPAWWQHAAPLGSRRRWAAVALRDGGRLLVAGLRLAPCPALRPHDLPRLESLLRRHGISLPDNDPAAGPREAARFVVGLLASRSDLRARFLEALSTGADGEFAVWLQSQVSASAAENVRAAFARKPALAFARRYDLDPAFRKLAPLALTPFGRRRLVGWWLGVGRLSPELRPEDLAWFLTETAERPAATLAATYRRRPDWQSRHPLGLTRTGWPPMLVWISRRYRLGRGLASLSFPDDTPDAPAVPVGSLPAGVNVLAHFGYPSGLAEAAGATIAALKLAGLEVSLRDVPVPHVHLPADREASLGFEPFPVTLLHLAPEPFTAPAYALAGLWRRPGVKRIGVWYWELEAAPTRWARLARELDEVWAPTRFVAEAIRPVMPLPVVLMPPGVPTPRPDPLPRTHFGLRDDRFVFLFAFDLASTLERKNPLGLIEAFRRSEIAGRATLVVKVTRPSADPGGMALLRAEAARVPGVMVIERDMARGEWSALLAACDGYISLHRSEGFGLTLAEAMLLGKPCIATGYSGNLDFMTPETSRLVSYRRVSIRRTVSTYPAGGVWAEPDLDEAAAAMRWMVDHPTEATRLGERGRQAAAEQLSLAAYGRRLREVLAGFKSASP